MGELQIDGEDAILGVPIGRSLGYELMPSCGRRWAASALLGLAGGGGVVTFVDPEAKIGFAYLNNAAWSGLPGSDPRAASITAALYSCRDLGAAVPL